MDIKALISWSGNNYCVTNGPEIEGCIVVTDKSFDKVKNEFQKALEFHIEGMIADGDTMPEWLRNGDYSIVYELETSALLRRCERFTSIAAISRASGINERQLSHYANGLKKPRPEQRKRIIDGLHKIGEEFLSVV